MSASLGRPRAAEAARAGRAGPLAVAAAPYAAVALFTFLLGLPSLILPLHPDQALFALVGQAVGEGRFPYIDAWDVKTPSVYLIYAVATRGPFGVEQNVRAFDLAWTALTAATVTALGMRWWGVRAGLLAGAIYGVASVTGNPWAQSAQPDSLLGLPLMLALLLYDSARGRRGRLVAAGMLLGFAFQLRFPVALLIPALPLVEIWDAPAGTRVRLWMQRMLWLGLGFGTIQAAFALYLLAGNALGAYLETMRFGAWYTRQGGPWNPPEGPSFGAYLTAVRTGVSNWALTRGALTLPALAGAFCGVFILRERQVTRAAVLAVLALLGVALQVKLFWYQFGPLLPLLALLGGWTWDTTLRLAGRASGRIVALGATGGLAAALVLGSPEVWDNAKRDWLDYVAYYRHPEERDEWRSGFSAYPERRRVAAYVRSRTSSGDTIYVWGFDPFLYLLAERPSASRFLVPFPLMSVWQPDGWRASFLDELRRRPPAYFIVQHSHAGSWVVGRDMDMAEAAASWPALQRWLNENYELEAEMDFRLFYRRRDAGS